MDQQSISGTMPLYARPELLTKEDHGHLGLRNLDHPFAFARNARSVPLMVSEFRSAQRFCPVVFTDRENPFPVAALGILENRNLFIDDQGRWLVPGYIPAYLRCYPFALASTTADRFALVVDRDAEMVSDTPDVPFFEGNDPSPGIQERIELCRTYKAEKERTEAFCSTLKRLDLLVEQEANNEIDGQVRPIAQYAVVDRDRLMKLDAETINGLFRDGSLGAIMAHLFSLDGFDELVRLRLLRASR